MTTTLTFERRGRALYIVTISHQYAVLTYDIVDTDIIKCVTEFDNLSDAIEFYNASKRNSDIVDLIDIDGNYAFYNVRDNKLVFTHALKKSIN